MKKSLANAVQEAEGGEPLPDRTFVQSVQEWAWNNKGLATVIGLAVTVWVVLALWNFAWTIGVYGGDGGPLPARAAHCIQPPLHAGSAGDGNLAINCQPATAVPRKQTRRHPQRQRVHELPPGREPGTHRGWHCGHPKITRPWAGTPRP